MAIPQIEVPRIEIPQAEIPPEPPKKEIHPHPATYLPIFDWGQFELAVRFFDPESEISLIYEEIIPPGVSGWVEIPLPEGRVAGGRFFHEWGDPSVKVAHAYNTRERLFIGLHHVPPTPTLFTKTRFWQELSYQWLLFRENTDTVNAAEYHVVAALIAPKTADWKRWMDRMQNYSRALLGIR